MTALRDVLVRADRYGPGEKDRLLWCLIGRLGPVESRRVMDELDADLRRERVGREAGR